MYTQYKQLTPMWGVRTLYVGSWSKVFLIKLQDKPKNLIKSAKYVIPISFLNKKNYFAWPKRDPIPIQLI